MKRFTMIGAVLSLAMGLATGCGTTLEKQEERFKRATDSIEAVAAKHPMMKDEVNAKLAAFKSEREGIVGGSGDKKKALARLNGRMETYVSKLDPSMGKTKRTKLGKTRLGNSRLGSSRPGSSRLGKTKLGTKPMGTKPTLGGGTTTLKPTRPIGSPAGGKLGGGSGKLGGGATPAGGKLGGRPAGQPKKGFGGK